MNRVRRFEHFDFQPSALAPPAQTPEGFWRVEGRVARTGVQEYTDASGALHGEFRSDEEVRRSLPGFARSPLTNNHPPQMVTPTNAKQYVEGAVGEAELHADGWVTAPLTLYTADAIAAMKAGRCQVSVGYSCEVVDESGEYEGTPYSHCQRNISVNHVAIVDRARAGPEARIRLDAGDAIAGDSAFRESIRGVVGLIQEKPTMPHQIKVDGFTFEVADPNAQAVIDRVIGIARKDGEDKAAAEKARADAAEKAKADLQKALSELQAKHDALVEAADAMKKCDECRGEGKVDGAKCDGCEGKGEFEAKTDTADKRRDSIARQVKRGVRSRATLLVEARRHLGAHEKLDDLEDLQIKRLVVAKLQPKAKLDGCDAVYLQARYDAAIELAASGPSAIDIVRTVTDPTLIRREDTAPADPDAARAAMMERNRNALLKKGA